MDSQEKYAYWLDSAQYDLVTAEAMARNGRWVYVAFMCQQAIEKLIKGLYVLYVDDNVPRTHNLRSLIEKFDSGFPKPLPEEHGNRRFDSALPERPLHKLQAETGRTPG